MRVILCDDNSVELSKLQDMVKKVDEAGDFQIELESYESADQMLFQLEDKLKFIDVLLIDINMPGLNGMEAAARLRKKGYVGEIVFTTVSKEHMLGAFDVRAFNYIVKGETPLEKIYRVLKEVFSTASEKSKEYMLFTGVGEYRNVAVTDIKYFEVRGKIITVYYGNQSFEFLSTIGKMENLLFPKGFMRVHRSFLVSIPHIKDFSYDELTLIDNVKIPIGRKYSAALREAMKTQAVG